jgi:hypothetical protein
MEIGTEKEIESFFSPLFEDGGGTFSETSVLTRSERRRTHHSSVSKYRCISSSGVEF